MSRTTSVALLIASLAVAALGQELVPQKFIDEHYGQRIATAKTTVADDDNLDVARQLVIAALDVSQGKELQSALARNAYELVMPVGTAEATGLALRALHVWNGIEPLEPVELSACYRDLSMRHYNRARSDRAEADLVANLAKSAVKAGLRYADLAMADAAHIAQAETTVRSLRPVAAVAAGSEELLKSIADAELRIRASRTRIVKTAEAVGRLKTARESGNAQQIRVAATALASLYLEAGELAQAAQALKDTGDERAKPLADGAAFAASGKLDPATALDAVEALLTAAKAAGEAPGGQKLGTVGRDMVNAVLAGNPPEVAATRGRMLLAELLVLLGETDADKFRKAIVEGYGGVNGKLTILDLENVRISYDMAEADQFKDWSTIQGQWEIKKGQLICKTMPGGPGRIQSKFRFRGDKPFKISIKGKAPYQLTLAVAGARWGAPAAGQPIWFRVSHMGATIELDGRQMAPARQLRNDGETAQYELASDGRSLTWTFNNVQIDKIDLARLGGDLRRGSVVFTVYTEGTDRTQGIFDDVAMEGAILPNPGWTPPAPAPRPRPAQPPAQPPRRQGGN